jgi:hypothetical protein
VSKTVSIDAYYVGIDRKQFTYERGTAEELRHNFAARLWRPSATEKAGGDFDYEGIWQAGTFGTAGIRAWTVASDSGYSFPTIPLKPRSASKLTYQAATTRIARTWAHSVLFFRWEIILA